MNEHQGGDLRDEFKEMVITVSRIYDLLGNNNIEQHRAGDIEQNEVDNQLIEELVIDENSQTRSPTGQVAGQNARPG